jgi:hypothetical protein
VCRCGRVHMCVCVCVCVHMWGGGVPALAAERPPSSKTVAGSAAAAGGWARALLAPLLATREPLVPTPTPPCSLVALVLVVVVGVVVHLRVWGGVHVSGPLQPPRAAGNKQS